jgi:hypothetical protein
MMIAPNRLPIVPPTMAVWRFSFAQVLTAGIAVAVKGVPVETAVAATSMGSLVVVGVEVCSCKVAAKVVVTLGADALLQQLFVSLLARQQYFPSSHVWSCHATGSSLSMASDAVVLLAYACTVTMFSRHTTRAHLWTCCILPSLVCTSTLEELADRRACSCHTESITQASILSRAATTVLRARITWRVCIVKSRSVDTVTFLTRSNRDASREDRKERKTRHHIREKDSTERVRE